MVSRPIVHIFLKSFPDSVNHPAIYEPVKLFVWISPYLAFFYLLFGAAVSMLCVVRIVKYLSRNRRTSQFECKTCGYDLYGNRSGRCPECGTPIDHRPAH